MGTVKVLVQIPLALEFIATDATFKVQLIAWHVNVLQVLLEVARGAIGALADGAWQGLKAAHDPWGWRERRAVSPGEAGRQQQQQQHSSTAPAGGKSHTQLTTQTNSFCFIFNPTMILIFPMRLPILILTLNIDLHKVFFWRHTRQRKNMNKW